MSLIEIRKVENKKDLKTFIDFHYDLYEGNEYDVPNPQQGPQCRF